MRARAAYADGIQPRNRAHFAELENVSDEDWDAARRDEVDLIFYLTRAAWPHLKASRGVVVNVGAQRDGGGGWHEAQRPEELREGVLANLTSLELDQVPVMNLRRHAESDVPFDEQVAAMVAVRDEGLIGAIGLSNVTLEQYRSARKVTEVACVQNGYNLADRSDQRLFDSCAADGVPYVPFFPLGSAFAIGNTVLTAPAVVTSARRLGITPVQVALAWLLQRSPNVLLIPGTSSLSHARENLAAAAVKLDDEALADLG